MMALWWRYFDETYAQENEKSATSYVNLSLYKVKFDSMSNKSGQPAPLSEKVFFSQLQGQILQPRIYAYDPSQASKSLVQK